MKAESHPEIDDAGDLLGFMRGESERERGGGGRGGGDIDKRLKKSGLEPKTEKQRSRQTS